MAIFSEDKRLLSYKSMMAFPQVTCFTTTRFGGVSEGNFSSLNCGIYTEDDPEKIKQNLEIVCNALPKKPKVLAIPHLALGIDYAHVGRSFLKATDEERKARLEGKDILMTKERGICVCVTSADCLPIAIYDAGNNAVCMVHAGWRGTVKHVTLTALQKMEQKFGTKPEDVHVVIGPGISLAGFEVGDEVYEEFKESSYPIEHVTEWVPRSHKYHINLWVANRIDMQEFGVPTSQIEMSGICTYHRYLEFFSVRRLTRECGRLLTGIMINY